jgi:hypothetical protein
MKWALNGAFEWKGKNIRERVKQGYMGQISGLYGVGDWDKWKFLGLGIDIS